MHFLLFSMSVVYVLTTPIPQDGENTTMEQIRRRNKWENDDYVCRGLILNGTSDLLFDIYQNVESSKELWDSLKAKYMADDASIKKFLVSNFTNYKTAYSRPVMEQYNKLLGRLRIVTSQRATMFAGPSVVNMVEHNNSARYTDNRGKHKHQDTKADPNKKPKVTCWKCGKYGHLKKNCKGGKVGNKANGLAQIDLKFSSGKFVSLFNVLHVSNIRKNLICNEGLCTAQDYYNEEYEEEREMEPRPTHVRETNPALRTRSPRARRQRGRVVEFEDAPDRDGSRVEKESEGGRPSKRRVEDNENRRVNLRPLLAAHLGRNENGQPLQLTLTSAYGGHQPSNNSGWNLHLKGTYLSYNALPFTHNSLQPSNGLVPTYVNPYSQPNVGMTCGHPPSYFYHAQGGNPSFGEAPTYHLYGGQVSQAPMSNYDDTLHILGLHKEQRIFGFVHGLKTRSLMEFLSTDLPTTYKGLMEKTYTWIEAKEVATNGATNVHQKGFVRFGKGPS
ncbi:zinc finger, CCHC-type containing protein [Tanacetum coccineum]